MKNFIELVEEMRDLISETRTEKGRGSREGRSAIKNYKNKVHSNPLKSKVRNYKSIDNALRRGKMGEKFSTVNSDRIYVITKHKWGKSKQQTVNGRTAKGFSPGVIPSSLKDIEGYSKRVKHKHGGASVKDIKGIKGK